MEKIKVIFTGGTIGSLAKGNDISPDGETKYLLLEKYGKNTERFVTSNPLFILSENANIANVQKMAEEIEASQTENIKGIIMTHGTDSLAYTAAMLSFIVQNPKVPIVLVSSNYILTDENANGVINFETAVELIDNPNTKPAIYVAYKNPEEQQTNIHLGTRMCEPASYSDSFYSPVGQRYAVYKDKKITFENTKIQKTDKKFEINANLSKNGLFINPHIGLDYNIYKNINCSFVLHNLYHSGTANTKDFENNNFDTNFLNFADFCKNKNIPLYLCNCKKKDVNYNSTNLMMEKNVKFLYDTTTNVALAKLYVAYNFINPDKIQEFLNTCIAGEFMIN